MPAAQVRSAAGPAGRLLGHAPGEEIGRGGMGVAHRAEGTRLQRKAAVGTMRPDLVAGPADRDRFYREATAAGSDHIVPIWHLGEAGDGSVFTGMPIPLGRTARGWCDSAGSG